MNATGALRVKAPRGDAQRHGKHATMNRTWVDRRAVLMRAGALVLAGMGAPFIRTARARALPTFDASAAFGRKVVNDHDNGFHDGSTRGIAFSSEAAFFMSVSAVSRKPNAVS